MANLRARIDEFNSVIKADMIDIKRLRKLAFGGCPAEEGLRSKAWKVLLNYLPLKTGEWPQSLKKQREMYQQFVDEMIIQPGKKNYENSRTDVTHEDHPLSLNPESLWSAYFKDNEMLLQIDKDCRRLCPDLVFFQSATNYPNYDLVSPEAGVDTLKKRVEMTTLKAKDIRSNRLGITCTDLKRKRAYTEDYVTLSEGQEAHWEVAERILFVYAKLNPGQGYVQGMNEILGPIYFSFARDTIASEQEFAEADTFWCFTNLMSEIRDNFIKILDETDCGIGKLMSDLVTMVKEIDAPLWQRLELQELKPQFYAFRWLTLLLSQEFALPDIIRLWDTLFADVHRFDFLISVCCAMLILIRSDLLRGDFPANMKLLQHYPCTDMQKILNKAMELTENR